MNRKKRLGADTTCNGSFEWNGHNVEFSVRAWGEVWETKEKRVDGNPTMILEFADSGVNVKGFEYITLKIDGVEQDLTTFENEELKDEIQGWLEEQEEHYNIEWEYESDYYD